MYGEPVGLGLIGGAAGKLSRGKLIERDEDNRKRLALAVARGQHTAVAVLQSQ